MSTTRIALANLRYPSAPDESVRLVQRAIAEASVGGADIVCFPECYVPGYRGARWRPWPPDAAFLERAWSEVAAAAGAANIAVVLGTERITEAGLLASVLVVNSDGTLAGFQDKVQVDPAEDGIHPHFFWAEADSYRPATFADPANTFHEKAALCRAAENTCYFATVNYASDGSPSTSAVARPDGTLESYQPYGLEGLLVADIELEAATGLLARRCRTVE